MFANLQEGTSRLPFNLPNGRSHIKRFVFGRLPTISYLHCHSVPVVERNDEFVPQGPCFSGRTFREDEWSVSGGKRGGKDKTSLDMVDLSHLGAGNLAQYRAVLLLVVYQPWARVALFADGSKGEVQRKKMRDRSRRER